jgi:hypothetical protein
MPPPSDGKAEARPGVWSRGRAAVDRWLAGRAPTDPLYLSNRTFAQRARIWLLIALPCLLVAGILVVVHRWVRAQAPPPPEPTKQEMAARLLPNLTDIRLPENPDIEVAEARIQRGARITLAGTVRNKSGRPIRLAELVFDLTDSYGSNLGGVSAKVENLAVGATAKFEVPLTQQTAALALVREVRTQ